MRFGANRQHRAGLVVVLALGLGGCASPPSVVPLMAVAQKAIQQEAGQLAGDGQREQASIAQSQAALKAGYQADLKAQTKLTADWVQQETAGYVAAREALVKQAMTLDQQRRQRLDNLTAAAEAQQRAIAILEQRDALLTQMIGSNPGPLRWLARVLGVQQQKGR